MQAQRSTVAVAVAMALCLGAAPALAHDSWFAPGPGPASDARVGPTLSLGTGNDFPLYDSGIGAEYLVRQGCLTARGSVTALRPLRNDPAALVLRAPPGAETCWAQLQPFEVELAPDKIDIYLRDIHASAQLRATWQAMQERGLAWHERYTKHARVLLASSAVADQRTRMDLDVRVEAGPLPLRVGRPQRFQVLRDGRPVADLPVQLRTELSRLGPWFVTDADGWISFKPPVAGRWLLRAVDLRLAEDDPDRWDSRFLTLAFEVAPALVDSDQKPSSFRSNTRSTSQIAATPAITSEPPTSTARR